MMYQRIRKLRLSRPYTQREVACRLGCSQQVYSGYELGRSDIPTGVLSALAQLYNTNVDYILGLTNIRKPFPQAACPQNGGRGAGGT